MSSPCPRRVLTKDVFDRPHCGWASSGETDIRQTPTGTTRNKRICFLAGDFIEVLNLKSDEHIRILGESTDFIKDAAGHLGRHPTGVSIFKPPEDAETYDRLHHLNTEFQEVFRDTGFAIVPEEELPKFLLRPEWENMIPKKCRPYIVNSEDNTDWAMELVRCCRAFGMNAPAQHMSSIFNSLDPTLRTMVSSPSPHVTVNEYLAHILDRQRQWRARLLAEGNKDLADDKPNMSINERLIRGIPVQNQITANFQDTASSGPAASSALENSHNRFWSAAERDLVDNPDDRPVDISWTFRQREEWIGDFELAFRRARRKFKKVQQRVLYAIDKMKSQARALWRRHIEEMESTEDKDAAYIGFEGFKD
ncbi:hypothetical protein GGR54DRAFT_638454 [Hypoxylon sp. NC1633]|nr:hypothetical protein GGR54DRAFT_638454 [Hypoxylon sp. NC1633]